MSNFKLYLEKAQGKNIDFKEIVSLNENFRNYMQKIYLFDEATSVLDFKLEDPKDPNTVLMYTIYNSEDTNAVKNPPSRAKYISLGKATEYGTIDKGELSINAKGIELIKNKLSPSAKLFLGKIGEPFKVNQLESEFDIDDIYIKKLTIVKRLVEIFNGNTRYVSENRFEKEFANSMKNNSNLPQKYLREKISILKKNFTQAKDMKNLEKINGIEKDTNGKDENIIYLPIQQQSSITDFIDIKTSALADTVKNKAA